MRRMLWFWAIVAIGMLPLTGCAGTGEWTSHFVMEGDELVSVGRNRYFILEPGYQMVLEGGGPTTSSTSAKPWTCTRMARW